MLRLLELPFFLAVTAIIWFLIRCISIIKFFWHYRKHKSEYEPYQFFITDIWAGIAALLPWFFMLSIILRHEPVWSEFAWLTLLFVAQFAGIIIASMELTCAPPIDRTDRSHRALAIIGGGLRELGGLGLSVAIALFLTPTILRWL
jgi:hypothetical protein